MKKALALVMAMAMLLSLAACGGSGSNAPAADPAPAKDPAPAADPAPAEADAAEGSNYNGITLTLMNSKPEITDVVKSMAKTWGDAHGVTFEVYETSNPNETLTQKYQAGDAPVLAIVDIADVLNFGTERMLPLDGEEWLDYTSMAAYVDGKVYGFPLCVESQCIVVNKTVVEANIGREFVPTDYKNIDAFADLLAEMRANGMENPVVVLPDVWSMCGHAFYQFYTYQDGTAEGAFKLVDDIKAGKDVYDDPVFADHMKLMLDVIKEYNVNKVDPLSADHDMSILELAEGNAAFLCNGSWTWPELAKMDATDDFVIMGYPNNTAYAGKVHAAPTKFIAIDNSVASAEQQAAAKEFLNYLVMDDAGQRGLVEDCGLVVSFTNNPYVPADPVNGSLMEYIAAGETVTYLPFTFPSDYRDATVAPVIQKLFADEPGVTVRDLADVLNAYWAVTEPKGR